MFRCSKHNGVIIIATCYATVDAVQIVNSFIYNLTLNNHSFRCVTFTQLTITYTVVTSVAYNTVPSLH
jgi:hypothetical protein